MKSKTSFCFQAASAKRLSLGSLSITGAGSSPSMRRVVFCQRVMVVLPVADLRLHQLAGLAISLVVISRKAPPMFSGSIAPVPWPGGSASRHQTLAAARRCPAIERVSSAGSGT